jgi:hypothetical protein
MKLSCLSKETQAVLRELLIDIEHLRVRANKNRDFPPSDYPYRPCQALIARKLGFENRSEWHNEDFLGKISLIP